MMNGQRTRTAMLIPALPMTAKPNSQRGRRNIRRKNDEDISALTLATIREEEKRKKRVQKRRALCDEFFEVRSAPNENVERLILDFECSTQEELISVDRKLVTKLKAHQREGVKFLWDACYESLEEIQSGRNGGGAVLAHCMGLGKTLQIITFVHTLFRHKETKMKTVLILSPVSTLLNWKAEFEKWLKDLDDWSETNVCVLQSKTTKQKDRISILSSWAKNGGVMMMGYEMFRSMKKSLTNKEDQIYRALQEPGPDLVICDEGHILKNDKTGVSKAMMEIRTPRKIMLTGTPLQNNLMEYYCMVQFVRPNLLGTKEEFRARFVNPIENAQYIDSTSEDVKLMMERTHLLHSILDGFVQRLDYNVLKPFLPPKHEFVVSIGLSNLQAELYEYYIKNKTSKSTLFRDCDTMRLIWTHPLALKLSDDTRKKKQKNKASNELSSTVAGSKNDYDSIVAVNNSEDKENVVVIENSKVKDEKIERHPVKSSDDNELGIDFDKINISTPEDKNEKGKSNRNQIKLSEVNELGIDFNKMTISSAEETNSPWWSRFVSEQDFEDYEKGPKLVLLFALLNACEKIDDKVLIFSQSIASLDMIEYFLNKNSKCRPDGLDGHARTWKKNFDYFRLDGQTPTEKRMEFCDTFNRDDNRRARLFLISTKAGGLGINLTAANRVIVFDATWNPSFDTQSIFRVYRLGQSKPCYIYRFISQGTMEEKIYDRQVVKQSVSCRVIDEQNIHRHFTQKEITELYTFNRKTPSTKPPELPSDNLMARLLEQYKSIIISYHVHDSLLVNIEDSKPNSSEIENVELKSSDNVKRHFKNIGHNLEEREHRPKNVDDKLTNDDRKCQPATDGRQKDWKDRVAGTIDKIKDEWIVKTIQKLYPEDLKFRDDAELLFQIRKKLFYEYADDRKRDRVNESFVTSVSDIPFEVAVDIIQVVEVIVPRYIQIMCRKTGDSRQTQLWNKETFIRQEVKKVETESIKEKLRQLYPKDWKDGKFQIMKIAKQVRKALFDRYMHKTKKDEFNKLVVAFVFYNDKQSSTIEDHVLADIVKAVVQTCLRSRSTIPVVHR